MTSKALNFLGIVAIICVLGLVALGIADNDQLVTSSAETTLASVLLMSVTGIAALVAPAALRRD